jgi:MFS family permease
MELLKTTPTDPKFAYWGGMLFYVPAVAGGIFGLLGGYLTDRLGRRRVLTWSILLYAFSKFFAGFSTSVEMLLVLRSLAFIGVCVEFVAAVAWVAELFPDPKQREKALGYTQAFSSIGGLMVAIANGLCIDLASKLPAITIPEFLSWMGTISNPHAPWRYTLISGVIPAIPLIVIRPFLPESPVWAEKRRAGTLKRPSIAALFSPELFRTTIFATIGFACSLGVAFGAIQQMPQIVPGLAEVREGTQKAGEAAAAAAKENAEKKGETADAAKLKAAAAAGAGIYRQKVASEYTKMQEVGGLVGRFVIAMILAAGFLSWGWTLRSFQLPGLILTVLVFWFFLRVPNTTYFEIPLENLYLGRIPVTTMSLGMFLVGLFTVAQLSFWGNYLPHVYPVHLRGTGESFAANIGGRLIGVFAALLTWSLSGLMPFKEAPLQFSTAAAIVGTSIYVIGLIASFWLPEPKSAKLDE